MGIKSNISIILLLLLVVVVYSTQAIQEEYQVDYSTKCIFILMGSVSLLFSLFLIFVYIRYQEMRQQPGDIILMISISDLIISIHWLLHATLPLRLQTYNSQLCLISGIIAVYFGSLIYIYNIYMCMYFISVIRNSMRKYNLAYHIGSNTLALCFLLSQLLNQNIGKNTYGTCSLKPEKTKNEFYIKTLITITSISIYIFFALYTVYYLKKQQQYSLNTTPTINRVLKHYSTYITFSIIICTLIVSKHIIILALYYNTYTHNSKLISIISNLFYTFNTLSSVMLTYLRLRDPFIKQKLKLLLHSPPQFNLSFTPQQQQQQQQLLSVDSTNINNIIYSSVDSSRKQSEQGIYINYLSKYSRYAITTGTVASLHYYFMQQPNKYIIQDILINSSSDSIQSKHSNKQQRIILKFDSKLALTQYPEIELAYTQLYIHEGIQAELEIIEPDIFQSIRDIHNNNMNNIDFKRSLDCLSNIESIKQAGIANGGKKDEFIFFSFDNQLIVKTLSKQEKKTLLKILPDYHQHLIKNSNSNSSSLISKIYGLYQIKFSQTQEPLTIIIQQNIKFGIPQQYILHQFNLKGSITNRQVLTNSQLQQPLYNNNNNKILKDVDFINLQNKIYIEPDIALSIISATRADSEFLQKHGIIDYSLLILIVHLPNNNNTYYQQLPKSNSICKSLKPQYLHQNIYYHLGIIDYFQLFNCYKKTEKIIKTILQPRSSQLLSVQQPNFYSRRFKTFVQNIVASVNLK